MCWDCYVKMQCSPYGVCCFGKPTILNAEGKVTHYGYNPEDPYCKEVCPHRKHCINILKEGVL